MSESARLKAPLPVRDGVGPSSVLLPAGAWLRMVDFLCAAFPDIAPTIWQSRLQRGEVVDDAGRPFAADSPYAAGMRLWYYRELAAETPIPFEAEIIHRDEHLLVADKPHFLAVMPAGRFLQQTLLVRLKRETGLDDLVPLHRIDRGTAGLVVFSLNPQTRGLYQSLFPRREVTKTYEALAPALRDLDFPLLRRSRLVEGEPFFRMREVPGTPNSETLIDVQERHGSRMLYRLNPVTGKKHQLRVHLAALGAGIVNDPFYPQLQPEIEDDFSRPLKLLARSIAFTDPLSGLARCFESNRTLTS